MSWGGAPMGPSGSQTSAAAGLPFAGIPSELAEKAKGILAEEPDHPEPEITFDRHGEEGTTFTLRSFLGPHWARLALASVLVILETIALQAGPFLTRIGIDEGVIERDSGVLVGVGIAYLVAVIVNTVTAYFRISYTGKLSESLMYDLRIRVFSHFQRLSLDFYTDERAGRLMTRMTSDIDALTALFQDGLVNLAVQGLTLLTITIVLFVLNPMLALITMGFVIPVMGLLTLWFRKASDSAYMRVRDRIADVLADLQESLSGMRVMTAYNRQRHNTIHHANVVGEHLDANVDAAKVNAIYGPGSEAVGYLGQALLLAIGGKMVLDGQLSTGELFAFLLYLTAFFAPIQQLVQLYTSYQQGQAAVSKLAGLLGTAPTVAEADDAVELPPIDGRLSFVGVDFGYTPDTLVLEGVDLEIAPGETVAVVGPTGAGKSTIAKLITRFYDPVDGSVSIDGHDLRSVTIDSLRRQLGVVPQEPFLFNGTIRDNVSFARPDATAAEVAEACDAVGVTELVAKLPLGLDSPVHERGSSLSSGERQLLALARAFLARPRVLVLDEATSNLDLASESRIERALDALLEGRTAIVIAHRLATALRADRIAVVDDGAIIELGSHEELVAQGGHYAQMVQSWVQHANITPPPPDA